MPKVRVETLIHAPIERCFDLARDLNAHVQTTGRTRERVVEGPADGMMSLGDIVTFEAVHFGIEQRLTSKIVEFDRPHHFVDEMQKGAFARMRHVHEFSEIEGGTLMVDDLDFASPFGPLGAIADRLFLRRYMEQFIASRGQALKALAEAND